MLIIDSHIHCGVQNVSQPFSGIAPLLDDAGIDGACLFAPVEDIYDRYDADFDDDARWRRCRERAHDYLLEVGQTHPRVYPYYFVWNDFAVEDLNRGFVGIKWHHHRGEPAYRYDDPRCRVMLDAICDLHLPVVLEETLERTVRFIVEVDSKTVVIIPHLGFLNGGYEALKRAKVFDNETVCADTALAGVREMVDFVATYGPDRLLFGSDYPFGTPGGELSSLRSAGFADPDLEKICSGNILRLLESVPGSVEA